MVQEAKLTDIDELQPNAKSDSAQAANRINVPELMAEIRQRVQADIEQHKDARRPFETYQPTQAQAARKAGELLYSEELRHLNHHYAPTLDRILAEISTHRGGFFGKLIVKVKVRLVTYIWRLFKGYFDAEREFNSSLVRYLNDVSKYVDARDASNFWELIRKVDVDVTRAIERIERLSDEYQGSARALERRVYDTLYAELKDVQKQLTTALSDNARQEDSLKTLDGIVRGFEGILARAGKQLTVPAAAESQDRLPLSDCSYLLLENRYRSSETEISRRMEIYPPCFKVVGQQQSDKPILEIGAGRGELLTLFKQGGQQAYAVDLDKAMVETCVSKGLDARLGDGLAHLRSLPERSLAGVIAVQVVEHLTQEQIEELCELCRTRVVEGGKVIFETINPKSLLALSSNYFRDPTHIWPLHPDTLSYTMTLKGLKVKEVRELSPVPAEAQLREVPMQAYMTPRWAETLELLNFNVRQLNSLIYGHQDYCVIAEV